MNFQIGQKVICINDKDTIGLVEGKTYTIDTITKCKGCKVLTVVVEEVIAESPEFKTNCSICNTKYPVGTPYYRASRFVPKITKPELSTISTNELINELEWWLK